MNIHEQPDARRRILSLACFGLLAAAVTGYFVGIGSPMNPPGQPVQHPSRASSHSHQAQPAISYDQLRETDIGPNRRWTTAIEMLKQQPLDPQAEIPLDPVAKQNSLQQRAHLRAFNGAPPVIPHSIDQMSSQACMTCHEQGIHTSTLRASKMPHPYYANCTQCHVEQNARHMIPVSFRSSHFQGLPAPSAGERAWQGAPPTVPHSTWMRQDCLSCHGATGKPGMQTTHPWRQNCLQCHGSSAELDQVFTDTRPRFLLGPKVIGQQ